MFTSIFATVVGSMMVLANATSFSTSTPGSYYEVSSIVRDPAANKTYSVWSRYDVYSQYNVRGMHFHVEVSEGNPTVAELVALAQLRSDSGIKAVTAVK